MTAPPTELWRLSALEGCRRIAAGALDGGDWVAALLDRIGAVDPAIAAFVLVEDRDAAVECAHAASRRIRASGPASPIDGAPVALKDCIDQAGRRTTGCSRLRLDAPPAIRDALLVADLRRAGAVAIGRNTLYELSYGGPSFDLPFPPARNPWDTSRIPGGSSSGSAAAVAAGCVPLAVGTDAGGSIRQPSSFCGVVGLKPTNGAVSRDGVLPMSLTLGDPGPIAKTVDDASALFDAISGAATFAARGQPVSGLRLAVLDSFVAHAKPAVAEALSAAVAALESAGIRRVALVSPPDPQLLDAVGRVILLAEAFAVHEGDLVADPSRYGRIARHRFTLGAFLSAADLLQAQRRRGQLAAAMEACFEEADLLVLPGEADVAPRFEDAGDSFPFTTTPSLRIGFNVTGHPALVVPSGFSGDGLPVAVQLAARKSREDLLFAAARVIERHAGVVGDWPAIRCA